MAPEKPRNVTGGVWTRQGKPCPTCGERFSSKESLREHRAKAHPVVCPVCKKGFAGEDGLKLHLVAAHPD